MYGLSRASLVSLAEEKLRDAELSYGAARYSNAYYLAGYAIELALKAIIARRFLPDTIPDKDFVKDIYSHDPQKLIRLAGLAAAFEQAVSKAPVLKLYWGVVCGWNESSRYGAATEESAQLLLQAVNDPKEGVLAWLKQHW